MMQFEEIIKPFDWVEYDDDVSVCLSIDSYKQTLFDSRAEEGFEGNGYDWQSLAQVFLNEKCPELAQSINFDSEGSMFCAYSKNKEHLQKFIIEFKHCCEDDSVISDLFSRAELD